MMIRNVLFISFVLILVACSGGGQENNAPQVQNTPTPEPTLSIQERTQFEAGRRENPLQMVIHPADTVERRTAEILREATGRRSIQFDTEIAEALEEAEQLAALIEVLAAEFDVILSADAVENIEVTHDLITWVQREIGKQVSDSIFERTSLYVDVVIAESHSEALTALCNSGTGIVAVPFLDGMTYAAAESLNCGQPALQIAVSPLEDNPEPDAETTEVPEAEATDEPPLTIDFEQLLTGQSGVIVVNSSLGTSDPGVITDRVYCRIGLDDFYSWFVPSLILEQNGIDLLRAPSDVIEYDTYDDLLEALDDGDCTMAGIPAEFASAEMTIAATSAEFPYGVFMYPLEVGLGVRLSLTENLQALAIDPVDGKKLNLLLGQTALIPAVADDFAELRQYITATGYDLAQLGN